MSKKLTKLLTVVLSLLAITSFSLACAPSTPDNGGEGNNPPQHTHAYPETYTFDSEFHWFECECGEDKGKAAHSFTDGKCICGYEKEEHTHNFSKIEHDENNHWKECACGKKSEVEKHALTDGKCICGYEKEKEHIHEYLHLEYNENYHWTECDCGDKTELIAHNGGSATCQKKAECTTCGQQYGELGDHVFVNNLCECGESNADYYTEGLVFKLTADNNSYYVDDYTGSDSEVIIPSIYNGKPVTSIDAYAFRSCYSLTSVVIGDSVTSIGAMAFNSCESLTSVIIPDSVTSIGDYAFYWCDSLTSVVIGDSVTSIGEGAFYSCYSLTKVNYTGTIDQWVQIEFGDYSATPLSYAKNLYINDVLVTEANITTATKISDYAFSYCYSLTSVIIPDSVISIGEYAFAWCDSLTSVEIGDGVTSIGEYAFRYCASLTSVVIGDSVTSIGEYAFSDCNKLQYNEYGNCKYLGSSDNDYFALIKVTNQNLSSYTIHENTKIIADYAFYSCERLSSIEIPDSVTSIGDDAFYYCTSLTSVIIPDSVTSIGDDAFYWCDSLTSVVIGDSVTSIGKEAFYSCDSLTKENITVKDPNGWQYKSGDTWYDISSSQVAQYIKNGYNALRKN